MKYETVDFKTALMSYRYAKANKKKYRAPYPDTFLEHVLPILASIPIQRNEQGKISPSLIYDYFNTYDTMIKTPNGEIHKHNLYYLLAYLYELPRSNLMSTSLNKSPKLGSLTPLPMYAYKLYNDIDYSEWDYNDKEIKMFLGNFLQFILPFTRGEKPKYNIDVQKSRELSLTYRTGAKVGTMAPITSYKVRTELILDNGETIVEVPKIVVIMLLQMWLANSNLRNTESMILDPYDWGNIPDALDQPIVTEKPKDFQIQLDVPWS